MAFTKEHLRAVMTGTQENRVEELWQSQKHPLKERETLGSLFWCKELGINQSNLEKTHLATIHHRIQITYYLLQRLLWVGC